MRSALLAAYRTSPEGTLRAGLMLAGRPVLVWQIRAAQALGCERVIVLSDAADAIITEAERTCRAQGIVFHRLRQFSGLAALLHTEDDLLLLGDGILPDQQALVQMLAPHGPDKPLNRAVLCLPAADPQAVRWPDDYERIDATRCWAGVAVMRAGPVQRLGDFPPDSNATSLLLRLALQAGTPCHTLVAAQYAADQWLLADTADALAAHEQALIARYAAPPAISAPGLALAQSLAGRLALRGPHWGPAAASFGGMACLGAAVGGGAAGWVLAALAAALAGSFTLDLGARLARLRQAVLGESPSPITARLHDPGRDCLAALALFAMLGAGALGALAPLAIGAARLAARNPRPLVAAFWQDRTAQLALMLLAAVPGWLAEAAAALALAGLAQALFAKPAQSIPE